MAQGKNPLIKPVPNPTSYLIAHSAAKSPPPSKVRFESRSLAQEPGETDIMIKALLPTTGIVANAAA